MSVGRDAIELDERREELVRRKLMEEGMALWGRSGGIELAMMRPERRIEECT